MIISENLFQFSLIYILSRDNFYSALLRFLKNILILDPRIQICLYLKMSPFPVLKSVSSDIW
jgi:hypothetical protein